MAVELKDAHIGFKLTVSDRKVVEKAAAKAGKKLSEFVHDEVVKAAKREIRKK